MSFIGLVRKNTEYWSTRGGSDGRWSAACAGATFDTELQALSFMWAQNWEGCEYRTIESDEPTTHIYDDGELHRIIQPWEKQAERRPKKAKKPDRSQEFL